MASIAREYRYFESVSVFGIGIFAHCPTVLFSDVR